MTSLGGCPTSLLNKMSGDKIRRKRVEVPYNRINYEELEFVDGDSFRDGGKFGNVRRAYYKKHPVAVKFFKGDERYAFTDELRNLEKLKHPHVVVMYGANPGPGNHDRYIVLEYAHNSLAKVLHYSNHQYQYDEGHVYHWAIQIAKGLEYMHQRKVVHRDIKSTNMLVFGDGHHIKLCDFGTARDLSVTVDMTKSIGTIRYMAPEMLRGEKYTFKCDIFSYGIVLWEMIARKPPNIKFGEKMPWEMIYYAMAKKGARPPRIEGIHPFFEKLINYAWHEESEERPSAEDIVKKLKLISSYFPHKRPLKRRNKKGQYVVFNPAKVKSGRKFLTSEKIAPSHLSGGSSAQRSQEGTSSSGVSTRTPEGSLDIVLVANKLEKITTSHELSSEQLPTDVMVIDKEPTPSSGDVVPVKSDRQDTTPPLPTVSEMEETAQKKHVQDEENMDDLPEPMNRPQAPNQLQINNNPSSGIPQTSPNRGQSSPLSFSTPMKSEEFLHRGGGRSVSANPPGPYPMSRAVNSREYSPNWYGTPYGTGVYGRGSFGPGYTSPPGPYWTQAPQFETHESIYEDHEEMTHEDVREEEYRSMNLVRKLYENIGSQMSGQDVDPVIPGSRFNPPSKYPNNGYVSPKKATPGSRYAIPNCTDPELQPYIPVDTKKSKELYLEYMEAARDLLTQIEERDKLKVKNENLHKQMDQQKLSKEQQKHRHETYQALCDQHDRLESARSTLNQEVEGLKAKLQSIEQYWQSQR